jgi:hypothetical protein
MKFDRDRFLQGGGLTLGSGVFGLVLVFGGDDLVPEIPVIGELIDELSPLILLVAPLLVVVGIVMIILGLTSAKDEPRSAVADAELDARTREIMETDGLRWTAAWHRARKEEPKASALPEPEQEPRDLEHRLRELKQLHDNGLIETEEYQRKQRLLLDGL